MKKRFLKSLIFAVCLVFVVCGFAACGKKQPDVDTSGGNDVPPSGGSNQCTKVMPYSIMLNESAEEFKIVWSAPFDGQNYTYKYDCNGYVSSTNDTFVDLRAEKGIALGADKTITITIVCSESGKDDSDPATKVLTAEGNIKLKNPQIKSFENGVLEWDGCGASNFLLKVNGLVVTSANSSYYTSNTFDTNAAGYSGALTVEITSIGDGVYAVNSDAVSFGINATHTKLTMSAPVLTVADGVLTWNAVGGAKGYRVVDINRSVKYVYPDEAEDGVFTYDMSDRVLVYGVYPDSSDPNIEDTPIGIMDLKYLDGEGTTVSPYLIKTAFDLRAIDYYEAVYAEKVKAAPSTARNNYRIENNINYLAAVDDGTNINKLTMPFFGTLDGNNKALSGIKVDYQAGHWALFDEIVSGATVKNITFTSPVIKNSVIDPKLPINASVATVAYNNGGTIDGIAVTGASYQAAGGEISGICSHNYGTVKNCSVSGNFKQNKVGLTGEACYEMAGVVLENKSGGIVTGNSIGSLTMSGTALTGDDGGSYNNLRTAAGIVAVNRKGGTVSNNSYTTVAIVNALDNTWSSTEFGGLVAYNAGTVTKGTGSLGAFTYNGTSISNTAAGTGYNESVKTNFCSKTVGKNEGTLN